MAKATVYIETTIVSYLTAWTSRDVVRAGEQELTRQWWALRDSFELYTSALVRVEASAGDAAAAAERLKVLDGILLLDPLPAAEGLAIALMDSLAVPKSEFRDAAHVALAAVHGIDYLLTWNCRHLANMHLRGKIEAVCRAAGYNPPAIGTPAELFPESR